MAAMKFTGMGKSFGPRFARFGSCMGDTGGSMFGPELHSSRCALADIACRLRRFLTPTGFLAPSTLRFPLLRGGRGGHRYRSQQQSRVFSFSLMEGYPSVRLAIPCLLAEEAERRMVRQGRLVLVVLVGILVAWSCPDPGEGKAPATTTTAGGAP